MSGDGRPLRWYADAPAGTRAHVAVRWATCPFGALDGLVPRHGRILDWGCGHGLLALWLAQRAPGRAVHGTDLDPAKVARAEAAAAATPFADRLGFEVVAAGSRPEGTWDAVVINDVLYLLGEDRQRQAVLAAADALLPGGTLVIKEMGDRPRWKAAATRLQERAAVGALGLTATEGGVHVAPGPERLVPWLAEAGLDTTVHRLDRGYHCPHVAVVGRRPPTGDLGSRRPGTP